MGDESQCQLGDDPITSSTLTKTYGAQAGSIALTVIWLPRNNSNNNNMRERKNILILFAHPALQSSKVNKVLLDAVRNVSNVLIHDLYECYPDLHINVQQEQRLLANHDIIVFQHPFYWYSSPAILKEWQDLVLEYGFAYGRTGTALRGKKLLTVTSTGGSLHGYSQEGHNRHTMREFLRPFEQTAVLCGMSYLPPFIVHGSHRFSSDEDIEPYAQDYRSLIEALRDGKLDEEHLAETDYLNDYLTPSNHHRGN